MAKRVAGSELNDRNWDEEDEPEEAGVFVQAEKAVLEQRPIIKAKRRAAGEGSGTQTSAFSGFAGLGANTAPKTDSFSLFKKSEGSSLSSGKTSFLGGTSTVNGDQKVKEQGDGKDSSSYLSCLKSLNESVLAWIKQHVENNPYIILSPIFKDYEKYLETITAEKIPSGGPSPSSLGGDGKDKQSAVSTGGVSGIVNKTTGSLLAASTSKSDDANEKQTEMSKAKPFSFGQAQGDSSVKAGFSFAPSTTASTGTAFKFTTTSSTPTAGFNFTQNSSESSSVFGKPSLFSSGPAAPSQGLFSFAKTTSTQQQPTSSDDAQDAGEKDNEEYEPPKPEVKEIIEADALYSKRCKLYYQKDGQWVDRGVGNLHLKPVADNKTQLLIRADTNLGNILLNIMLSSTMPVSHQGKNNITLACIPNPPISTGDKGDSPVPMLIRVKTEEDAKELLEKIEERKKLL